MPENVLVMIETPKGSAEKYNYDPALKALKFKKILPAGMFFPYDFGFIPDTKAEDGDPLDVIVISEFKGLLPGCYIDCRIIGVIKALQTVKGKSYRNDRLLAIPLPSVNYGAVNAIEDLPWKNIDELIQFFVQYNRMEGKDFVPEGIGNAEEAHKIIEDSKT